METFHSRLLRARAACHKSIKQIAAECGVSRQTVSSWIHRGVMPKPATLGLLAACLGVSVDMLVNGKADHDRQALIDELTVISSIIPKRKLLALLVVAREFSVTSDK